MITFCKMSMLACNYRDGEGNIDTWLNSREKTRALKKLPSLANYVCYMFNLGSSVCGPCFEYKEWDDFINLSGHYSKMRVGSNVRPALLRALNGLLLTQIGPIIEMYFPVKYVVDPMFADENFLYKIVQSVATYRIMVMTYYTGFCFMEANQIASGFGYALTETGEESYNNIRLVDMTGIETSGSVNEVSILWNTQIHLWLKNYVYLRLLDRSKPRGGVQGIPVLLTYVASAMWHGVYPGFFVFFMFVA